jgi:hypothetical protein
MGTVFGMTPIALRLTDSAACLKCFCDLIVKFSSIGDDYEGPIAGNLSEDLLGKEDHRKAFAGALRLPEDASSSMPQFTSF